MTPLRQRMLDELERRNYSPATVRIHLVRAEHPDTSDEPQVDPSGLSGLMYVGNSGMVTDLVLLNGHYIAIEHVGDGMAHS